MTKNLSLIYTDLSVKLQLAEAVYETEMQGGISPKKQPKPQYEELLSFVYITQIPQV